MLFVGHDVKECLAGAGAGINGSSVQKSARHKQHTAWKVGPRKIIASIIGGSGTGSGGGGGGGGARSSGCSATRSRTRPH